MDSKKVLFIGAGTIAFRRLKRVLDFTKDITIISSDICNQVKVKGQEHNLKIEKRDYKEGDIEGFDIVIVAVNNISLQEKIYLECKGKRILYNCCDIQEYCDFIFPSYIKEGDLTITISTNGSSPAFAKSFKEYIKNILPKDIASFLKQMRVLRQEIPKGKERMTLLDNKVKEYFKSWN